MDLSTARAVVTGGASGLGFASAKRIIEAGGHAALLDVNADQGSAAASELGERAMFIQTDVSSEEAVRAAMRTANDFMGGITLAVLTAQARQRQLAAHGFTVLVVVQTLGDQRLAKIGQAQVVLLSQALHRLVELSIGNLDTAARRFLQHQGIVYQGFEYLPPEHLFAGQAAIAALEIDLDQLNAVVEIALGDDAFIDDRDNAVEPGLHGLRGCAGEQ